MCVCRCRKFNKTIEILQGDIESLENDKQAMERRLDQESKKSMLPDTTGRRMRGSSFGNAFGLQRSEGKRGEGATGAVQEGAQPPGDSAASPLLLARVGVCVHMHVYISSCVCTCTLYMLYMHVCTCTCTLLHRWTR